jgi:ornithine cyclodeaminase
MDNQSVIRNHSEVIMQTQPLPSVPFLSAARAVDLLRYYGVPFCVKGMARCLEEDFSRWADFEKVPRVASHSASGVIELMPISDGALYSFKYVNGHPKNEQHGLPTVMAFGVLADVETGMPLFMSELTLTTALRTAATSALVARHLARPDSHTMALIGNGAQGAFQALAFHALLGIRSFRLFDVDPQAMQKLAAHLEGEAFEVVLCHGVAEAVQGADVVTTITADKTKATILTPDMIQPGMHINAVGGDCPGKTELHPDVLRQASVFVEFEPQTRVEGDIQQLPSDFPVSELWQLFTAQVAGRKYPEQVTVFDSVGFALEDFSALRYMWKIANEGKALDALCLIPALTDPKDLYGLLQDNP